MAKLEGGLEAVGLGVDFADDGVMEMTSYVIPAHNEAREIGATIAAIRAAAMGLGRAWEVVVADDGSTDGTGEIARSMGAVVVRHERRQISATRNLGARAARGDVVIFVDADTRVSAEVVRAAHRALEAGAVGGGATIAFDGVVPLWGRVMLPVSQWLLRTMNVCGGCFVFCRAEGLAAAGGWNEELFASEEIALARALQKVGPFVVLREPVETSGRKLRTYSGWEILGMSVKMCWRPGAAVRSRERLGIWYDERREESGDGFGEKVPKGK